MYNGAGVSPDWASDAMNDDLRQLMHDLQGPGGLNSWSAPNGGGSSYGSAAQSSYPGQQPVFNNASLSNWAQPTPSSYSTLNGALSPPHLSIDPLAMQPQQPHQQQYRPHSASPFPPSNGFGYGGINPLTLQPQQQGPPPQPSPQQQTIYRAQLAQQQQAQLALHQQALHSPVQQQFQQPLPQTVAPRAINPVAFYAPEPPIQNQVRPTQASPPAPSPPAPSAEPSGTSLEAFIASLEPCLAPRAFAGAGSVRKLVDIIDDYGLHEVAPAQRLEIANKILVGAGNNYYRAWMENATAMQIVREWLKSCSTSEDDDVLATTMPLLTLLDRLPVIPEALSTSKVGPLIRKMGKRHEMAAVRDLAQNIERKWREKLNLEQKDEEMPPAQGEQGRKRKASTASAAPPSKKAAVAPQPLARPAASTSKAGPSRATPPILSASRTTVRPAAGSTAARAGATGAKADASFFSEPKKKLPSFKKAPAVKTEAVAKPKAGNPFQEALAAMGAVPSSSMSSSAAAVKKEDGAREGSADGGATGALGKRKRKSVRWAPEGKLEAIKYIDKAIYDDDGDGAVGGSCLRDLEKAEGAAMHHAVGPPFEELIDWTEPSAVELPEDLVATYATRGANSQEVAEQAERELSAVRAIYLVQEDTPETPAEATATLTVEETDRECRKMLLGEDMESLTAALAGDTFMPDQQQQQAGNTVAGLLSSLAGSAPAGSGMQANLSALGGLMGMLPSAGAAMEVGADAPDALLPPGLDMAQLRALLANAPGMTEEAKREYYGALDTLDQSASAPAFGGFGAGSDYGDASGSGSEWNSGGSSYGGDRRGSSRGRAFGGRGRGRGRGRSRVPCSFHAQGRCKYGDQCDFSHDLGGW